MDLKEGTLRRVAPSKHPVERLNIDTISEDSDEDMQSFYSKNSINDDFTRFNSDATDSNLTIPINKSFSHKR